MAKDDGAYIEIVVVKNGKETKLKVKVSEILGDGADDAICGKHDGDGADD